MSDSIKLLDARGNCKNVGGFLQECILRLFNRDSSRCLAGLNYASHLLMLIYGYQLAFFDYKLAAGYCKSTRTRLAEHHRGHRVMQRPGVIQAVQIDRTEIGAFPGFQAADVGAAQHGCPPRVASSSAVRAVINFRFGSFEREKSVDAFLQRESKHRLPHLSSRCDPSLLADPSTPRPTFTPAARYSFTGAIPEASRMFELGQCATPQPYWANVFTSSLST